MSMILGQYKIVRTLGQGAFGTVYLVVDKEGNKWAIKEMKKKKFEQNQAMEYLQNEIEIMKKFNSDYIVKLYKTEENAEYVYLIIEFCNGKDLMAEMKNQENKVFTLENATAIVADVLRGLEVIHGSGCLHRDIKVENILVHTEQNGRKLYKIADFGLSKNSDKGETLLGSPFYIAPEVLLNLEYGFEVDMWSLGVALYFLLNKEYPFKISPHLENSPELKHKQLVRQAKDFSYTDSVNKSKYKFNYNCTPAMEDLFSRMFQIDQNKRLTFWEIRSHPVFRKHFQGQAAGRTLSIYKKNIKVKDEAFQFQPPQPKDIENENVSLRQSVALEISHTQKFPKQKEYLHHRNNQIEFLYNNCKEFSQSHGVLTKIQKIPLCYNLIKYYIILKRHFLQAIKSGQLSKQEPNYKFDEYFKTISFKKQFKEFEDQLENANGQFELLHDQCVESLDIIQQFNSKFKAAFNHEITETDLTDPFKQSYRKSTIYTFDKLKKFLKENNKGNTYNYYLALAVISHIFNRVFTQKQKMAKVFRQFLQQSQAMVHNIDYDKLREWMSKASPTQLNAVTRNIIKNYFEVAG